MGLDLSALPTWVQQLAKSGVGASEFTPDVVSQLTKAYQSGALSTEQYTTLLGMKFGGDANVKGAWDNLVRGLVQTEAGAPGAYALGAASYKSYLKKVESYLPKDFRGSSSLLQGLVGTQDPVMIAQRAAQIGEDYANKLAQKYLGVALPSSQEVKDTIRLVSEEKYVEAWRSMDVTATAILQKASPTVATVAGVYSGLSTVAGAVSKIRDVSSGNVDAAGKTVGIVGAIADIIDNITDIAVIAGMSKSTATEIKKWNDVGSGCVTSIAAGASGGAAGVAVGALSCGIQILAAGLSYLGGEHPAKANQMAQFAPSPNQLTVITQDAQRLASTLRAWYGITSYQQLYDRVKWDVWMTLNGGYPPPTKSSTGANSVALTGYTMVHALVAMDFGYQAGGTSSVFHILENSKAWELDLYNAWFKKYGSSQSATATALYKNEKNFEGDIDDCLTGGYDVSAKFVDAVARDAAVKGLAPKLALATAGYDAWAKERTLVAGHATFLRVHELLNLFETIVRFDEKHAPRRTLSGGGVVSASVEPFAKADALPLRFWAVMQQRDCSSGWGSTGYDPKKDAKNASRYDKRCWTNFLPCGYPSTQCFKIWDGVTRGNACDIREFAFIRLLCAFSYMHWMYMWQQDADGNPLDLIADSYDTSDPTRMGKTGLNPRTYVANGQVVIPSVTTMLARLDALNNIVKDVSNATRNQLDLDRKQYLSIKLAKMIKVGNAGLMVKQIEASGGSSSWLTSAVRSGAVTLTAKKVDPPATGGGALPLIAAAAGAALLLRRFF